MATTVTLVAEAVQGAVTRGPVSLPATAPTTARIDMQSSVFGADATLSFRFLVEESFDGGASWMPAGGYPATMNGGTAGFVYKGVAADGLFHAIYAYDGRARLLRATGTPSPGPFDWGLTASLL